MMDDRIRTSDADRDRVADRLRDHYAEGRLTRDEFDERLADALGARTFGELRQVLTDLPEPALTPARQRPVPMTAGPVAPPAFRYRRRGPRFLPVLALALLAAVLISGGGAAVLIKLVAITAAVMFALFVITAVTIGRFVHRVRRQWYQQQFHQQLGHQHWHHGRFSHHGWSWSWPDS